MLLFFVYSYQKCNGNEDIRVIIRTITSLTTVYSFNNILIITSLYEYKNIHISFYIILQEHSL